MNIRFLGTGFGAPYKNRHQQSILIEVGENAYLFDAGAPVTDILSFSQYDMSRIKTVFISHLHGDHMNGLNDMINLAEFFNIRCDIYLSEERGIDAFKTYTYMQLGNKDSTRINFKLIKEGIFYDDGILKVTSYQNDHMKGLPCYSFLIEAEGRRVYITSDLSPSLIDLPDIEADMLIIEAAHFDAETVVSKCNKLKVDKVAFVHVMPPEKYENIKAQKAAFTVLYPNDGEDYIL
ncbi:MAG: MBL fold metallo-hydrolase [Clostridia bacterium]|nr:MBL fold metallo-hydrolase [Clostridia bacterium]